MKQINTLLLILLVMMVSCKKDKVSTLSSDTTVTSFKLKNDNYAGLSTATFVIETLGDTGKIYVKNHDSLLYKTRIDSVVPYITYNATPSQSYIIMPDTTVALRGNDTLNFAGKDWIYLKVVAADTKVTKFYRIEVNVHQMDPDLYTWERLSSGIWTPISAEQNGWLTPEGFRFMTNDGLTTWMYTSTDARKWERHQVVGLPADCHPRYVVWSTYESVYYYGFGDVLYRSTDGINWSAYDHMLTGCSIRALVMEFNDLLWALVEEDEHLKLACYMDHMWLTPEGWANDTRMDSRFPVEGYDVVPFEDATGHQHILVAGGLNHQGEMLRDTWSMECVEQVHEGQLSTQYRLVDYAEADHTTQPYAYTATVWYNRQLIRFGGMNKNREMDDMIRYSKDEGMSWDLVDPAKNCRPDNYQYRHSQVVLTDGEYIYLIGGQSRTHNYTDVWRARLSSILW